jgi:hypothetical protein
MLYRLLDSIVFLLGFIAAFAALFLVPLELIFWGIRWIITGTEGGEFLHKRIAEAL